MRKLTIEYVKAKTKEIAEGYECLSDEYVGNKEKLEFRCNKGHIYEVTWNGIVVGHRCLYCAGQIITIEKIRECIKPFGYELLSEIYINDHSKLKFKCDEGHIFETIWRSIYSNNNKCPICYNNNKKTIEEVKEYIESFGYELLSNEYVDNHTKLKLRCNVGHIYKATWAAIQQGQKCLQCKNNRRRLTIEYVKYRTSELTNCKYKCLSNKYINSKEKLIFRCDKNHKFLMCWCNFNQGQRCPTCYAESRIGENNTSWKNYSEEDRKNIELYRGEVVQLSKINYRKYYYLINPFKYKLGRYKYHLDHIYSVMDGFNNGVLPEIIACPINLQVLWWRDNLVKHSTSHMTLEQLYDLHKQFLKEV